MSTKSETTGKWITDDWTSALGAGPLSLFAGESPAGLRLPLGAGKGERVG